MDFTVPMALIDYIPVICFAISAVILMRDLYGKMGMAAYALFSAGVIDITIAGALKATYKLLYASGVCNFTALTEMFFPVQSIGFLLAGVGILLAVCKKKGTPMMAIVPPVFKGTFLFVGVMVAGLGLIDTVLSILAFKIKKSWVIALFVISFVCSLCMGYLSSQDFAEAAMNWIAEGVNVVGQGTMLAGVIVLHKNGLKELSLDSGDEK